MSCFFRQGDVHTLIKTVPDNSVDLIYQDPPFHTTKNSWDEQLQWKQLFAEYFRILKPTGMLVIHCSIPFNYELIRSAPKPPSYSWYWNKQAVTCPLIANQQPLRCMEEVLVWRKQYNTYYRQNVGTEKRTVSFMKPTEYYGNTVSGNSILTGKTRTHLLEMERHADAKAGAPKKGQKRVKNYVTRSEEMIELFLKHYTKEGDVVLDPTCYKGLTGKVAKRLKRRFIGFDKHFLPTELIV